MTEPEIPDETIVAVPEAAPATRLGLGVLASVVVVAVGVALWVVLVKSLDKEYFGVSVAIGLLVGYALREVSRRSDLLVRVLAVLLTAVACVVGTLMSQAAVKGQTVSIAHLPKVAYLTFVGALVVAYISATPPKPKKVAAPPTPAEPVDPGEGSVDVDG